MFESKTPNILETVKQMQSRTLTATELVDSCLERIFLRERAVRAWVEVYEEQA